MLYSFAPSGIRSISITILAFGRPEPPRLTSGEKSRNTSSTPLRLKVRTTWQSSDSAGSLTCTLRTIRAGSPWVS